MKFDLFMKNFIALMDFFIFYFLMQEMKLGWQIIVGTIFGAIGGAFGSIGGIGGGGFFVPMLRLIVGFDPKSATAMSKCKTVQIHVNN